MSTALLLAEPDLAARRALTRHLSGDGFRVVGAAAGTEAIELAAGAGPDVVVLGEPLPDVPSLEVCRRVRESRRPLEVPVIVLGPDDCDAVDRARALEGGVDDYLVRPFVYDELLARIRAVLRRVRPPEGERIRAGEISVDRATRTVRVRDERVALAGKEYELLVKLASDPLRVWTKEQLLRDVWGFRSYARTRTLDSHACRLRKKLAAAGAERAVVNVWGVGYRLLD